MKKMIMIVYFHGYGSSRNSSKVARLKKEKDFNVFSFNVDIDPDVARKQLVENIDMALVGDRPEELVFVGTSLGAWWAGRMAKLYQCKAVIINPSINPGVSLAKYGISQEILDKYHLFPPHIGHKYFFAKNDEVIDNETFRNNLIDSGYDVTVDDKADHRFGGDSFEKVVSYLKTL